MGMSSIDYENNAADYHAARSLPLTSLEEWRKVLARYLPKDVHGPVLDLGCGTGLFSRAIAIWFDVAVLGVDPSTGMLLEAKQRNGHPLVEYLKGEAMRLPLRDRSCRCAWLSTVIHHIPSLPACAQELRRVIEGRGKVIIRSAFPEHLDRITLFRFFDAARQIANAFPSLDMTVNVFASAGFVLEARESVSQVSAVNLRAACEQVRLMRHMDSTLAPLSDDEFERGMVELKRAADSPQASSPVVDYLDMLVFRPVAL